MRASQDDLHLWHLVEDVDHLYALLRNRIETWGQLQILLKRGGGGLVETDDPGYRHAHLAAVAIEAACEAWRIGRGKDVDREALQESGCISASFMDAVSELGVRVGNRAEGVIRGLKSGEIMRWRQANTEKLRIYFESNGYLSSDEPLQAADIRVRILASVADAFRDGSISEMTVDRIIGSLPN